MNVTVNIAAEVGKVVKKLFSFQTAKNMEDYSTTKSCNYRIKFYLK